MDTQLEIRMARGVKGIERNNLAAPYLSLGPAVTHFKFMKYKGKPELGSLSIVLMDLII